MGTGDPKRMQTNTNTKDAWTIDAQNDELSATQHQEGGEVGTFVTTRVQTNTNSTLTIAPWRRRGGNGDEARSMVEKETTASKQKRRVR